MQVLERFSMLIILEPVTVAFDSASAGTGVVAIGASGVDAPLFQRF
jgi:hypothetical protein